MTLTVEALIERLNTAGKHVDFEQVMQVITNHYHYQASRFSNGDLVNEAGSNEGSCKIFAFALLHNLSEQATLECFGDYYRQDVLKNPTGTDHGNIRHFMKTGWAGIHFDKQVLTS